RFYESNRGHTFIGDPEGKEAVYPDYVTVAEGFRVKAERVASKKELPAAMKRMIAHDGPYLLDVTVPNQEHVLPMIPSGMTFADIITE
ncbi:MAG: thiamine pyrophosphate-dependent enzyme, partial [Candidatus Latescibacterota bacterium]